MCMTGAWKDAGLGGDMEEERDLDGQAVGAMELLDHAPCNHQGMQGRELSWLSQLFTPSPDGKHG